MSKTLDEKVKAFCYDNTGSMSGMCDLPDEDIYKAGYTQGRQDALRECLEIYEKGFEQNWVVQDVLDAIQKLMQQEEIK